MLVKGALGNTHILHHMHWGAAVNSSAPRAAYMHQWTGSALVQIMTCRLFGAKPLPEPILTCCQLDPWKPTSVKYDIHENAFENAVCEIAAILSRGRWVNSLRPGDAYIGKLSHDLFIDIDLLSVQYQSHYLNRFIFDKSHDVFLFNKMVWSQMIDCPNGCAILCQGPMS